MRGANIRMLECEDGSVRLGAQANATYTAVSGRPEMSYISDKGRAETFHVYAVPSTSTVPA